MLYQVLGLKNTNDYFDITMGTKTFTQVTDLVGKYILYHFHKEFPDIKGELCRDDTLFFINSLSNRKLNLYMEKFHNFFKRFGLSISIKNEHNSVNYLDVNLNLITGLCSPYHKPNSNFKYINFNSNHLKAITRTLV